MSVIGTRSAAFEWTDLPGLHDLVASSWGRLGWRSPIHLGDLYWMLRPGLTFEPARDIQLWKESSGKLVGAAWFTGWAKGEVLAEALDVAGEGLEWLEASHRSSEWAEEHPCFSFEAWENDPHWDAVLRAHGYLPVARHGVRLTRPIDSPAPPKLPPGFRLVPVTADRDVLDQRTAVLRAAFEGSQSSPETWAALRKGGGYRPDLDVFLVDEDGNGAASALCWYDEVNRWGEFEPVGTNPRYQGLGLGRAVMAEGLRRLAAAGATSAVVSAEADNAVAVRLYESAGFTVAGFRALWRKDF